MCFTKRSSAINSIYSGQQLFLHNNWTNKHYSMLTTTKTKWHSKNTHNNVLQWGSVTHQMAVPVPSISCCVLNHHNLFYQIQNALAFNWDKCCHLVPCLQLLPFHYFVPGKLFRPSLMFAGKVRDKRSSLLRKVVTYDCKEFYNIYPR